MASASASGRAENRVCGDRLELFLSVEEGRIAAASWEASGCAAVRAAASLTTEAVLGRTPEEALELDVEGEVERAGGLPPTKAHAPRVVQRALREALANLPPR
jgi:nitrogen fixation NifU-like protein